MRRIKSYSKRLLLAFELSSLAVLALFSLVVYIAFNGIYSSSLRNQSVSAAVSIAGAMDEALRSYKSAVDRLSQDPQVEAYLQGNNESTTSLAILREMYDLKNQFPQQATITAVRLDGGGMLTTGSVNARLLHPAFSTWGAFREANASSETVVYTVSKDAVLDETTRIALVRACRTPGGSCIGYLLIELPRHTLTAMANENAVPYTTALMMTNRNDAVIYHSEGEACEGLGKIRGTGDAAGDSGTLWDGTYAFGRADEADVLVLIQIPTGIFGTFNWILGLSALIALAFGALIGTVVSYRQAQLVSRPIQELRESMARVRAGDLTAKVEVKSEDEIGQLGESFNEMTARIDELVRNVRDQQESLRVAEAKALSLQVNPHFIYNTLELIRWSAKLNKPDVVVSITVNFGRLLRRLLNNKDDLVTVQYEMEWLESYLEIQKCRYGDRLQLDLEVDPEVLPERIPKLLLQPLVENAIVHGLENKVGVGRVVLRGHLCGDYLRFVLSDNGVGMSEETLERVRQLKENGMFNIGLANVGQRAAAYGDSNCGLKIESELGKGTTITLTVKRQPDGEAAAHV